MFTKADIESGKTVIERTDKMEMVSKMFKEMEKPRKVWPVGSQNLQFRRVTGRYAQKGSFSSNTGYLRVMRDAVTGRFVSISG